MKSIDVRRHRDVLMTVAVAFGGGALFALLGLPAAWLAGSMIAIAAAALAGESMDVPAWLRSAAFVLVGVSLGSRVAPETITQMWNWPLSMALLIGSTAVTMLAGSYYLEKVHRWDRMTARLASMPGALSSVVALAATNSANLPRVALTQSIRVFALVALMPALLRLSTPPAARSPTTLETGAAELLALLAASGGLAALLAFLRIPGGVLLGAMLASALLHGTGLIGGRPPQPLLIAGFVVTGAAVGARFRGTSIAMLGKTVPAAIACVLLALIVAGGFAAFGAFVMELPFNQVWVAYAPGGVEAMAAMALALNVDPAFVGAHHILRLLGLNLLSSRWARARSDSSLRGNG